MELLCVCLTCQGSFYGLKPFLHHIKTVEMEAHGVPAHFILSFFGVSLCWAPTTDCTYCLCLFLLQTLHRLKEYSNIVAKKSDTTV